MPNRFFAARSSEKEILDDPAAARSDLYAALDFMTMINRFFGGVRAVTGFFEEKSVPDDFTVLDLGSGGGDIPHALVLWARSRRKKIRVTALDLNSDCLDYARQRHAVPEIDYVKHSAFDAAELGKFDYVISSMFFHHLSDAQIVSLLEVMKRQAWRGFLVNDLYRGQGGYAGATFLGGLSRNFMVYHDARLSVRRAFREEDFVLYRSALGLPEARILTRPFFRILFEYHVPDSG